MVSKRHTVGIFSREGSDSYKWLVILLQSVAAIIPVYISNNVAQFTNKVSECTFAILYHSKKRGRLNVTDVTDSLYDEELKYLSDVIGKDNVLVIMDDLDDSSDEEKGRILRDQWSIEQLAKQLFLFSEMEKRACNMNGSDPRFVDAPALDYLQDAHKSFVHKTNNIKKMLTSGRPKELFLAPSVDVSVGVEPHHPNDYFPSQGLLSKEEPSPKPKDNNKKCTRKHKIIFGSLGAAILILLIVFIIVVSTY
ncbi:uncharacterized protein O3C94_013433 [Discoglossus pictus]